MFNLGQEIQEILNAFAPLFSKRVWFNVQILIIGAILCIRKRTVTSVLRVMGLGQEKRFTNFHRVLNRAKCNVLQGLKILPGLLILLLPKECPLIIGVDFNL